MNILISEDDKITLQTLKNGIENLGHKVHATATGEEAIKSVEKEAFDVIITDIMMPGISGLSLIKILRNVNLCRTPIIVMSALNNDALLNDAFESGANDYIEKPFTIKDITEKLDKYKTHSE